MRWRTPHPFLFLVAFKRKRTFIVVDLRKVFQNMQGAISTIRSYVQRLRSLYRRRFC